MDKKINLFALRQKTEFGLCKKLENFVITKTSKMPTVFVKRQNLLFPLTADLPWVILFRNQSTLLVTQKIFPLSFAGRVSKVNRESLLPVLIKMFMLTSRKLFHTNFCARDQFLFGIKRLSKFLYKCFEI